MQGPRALHMAWATLNGFYTANWGGGGIGGIGGVGGNWGELGGGGGEAFLGALRLFRLRTLT